MYGKNDLFLDIELLYTDLRAEIGSKMLEDYIVEQFTNEIHIVPFESDLVGYSEFPAILLTIVDDGAKIDTIDDSQVQPFSNFTVEIEIYTSGLTKRGDSLKLSKAVKDALQTTKQLTSYYNRGLKLLQDRELSSLIDGVTRRQLRFNAVCDNERKYIYTK
jgi:hypothetical protein